MNNKGADQTAGMCRLVCTCVVSKPPKTGFLTVRPICSLISAHAPFKHTLGTSVLDWLFLRMECSWDHEYLGSLAKLTLGFTLTLHET